MPLEVKGLAHPQANVPSPCMQAPFSKLKSSSYLWVDTHKVSEYAIKKKSTAIIYRSIMKMTKMKKYIYNSLFT